MACSNLPFDIVSVPRGDGRVEIARFVCASCETRGDKPLIRTKGSFNPEATIKRAEGEGWRIRGLRVECPRCITAKGRARCGESPGPKPIHTAEVIPLQLKPTAAPPLSPDQRLAVRALLEKHFDEGIGRYVGGYSDQRIAEECKVPRASVETIRDAAYGPIRQPPELDAADNAMAALAVKAAEARTLANALLGAAADAEGKIKAARSALGLAA